MNYILFNDYWIPIFLGEGWVDQDFDFKDKALTATSDYILETITKIDIGKYHEGNEDAMVGVELDIKSLEKYFLEKNVKEVTFTFGPMEDIIEYKIELTPLKKEEN